LVCSALFLSAGQASANDPPAPAALLYHNVAETYPQDAQLLHITPQRLEEHMRALVEAGYSAISFYDWADFVEYGKPLPPKPVIISFDDGYLGVYEHAFPTLKKLGLKATSFIVVGSVGSRTTAYPHFDWAQAREMRDSGVFDIESHTNSHAKLPFIGEAAADAELRRARYIISMELAADCGVLAYPEGLKPAAGDAPARAAGYRAACIVTDEGVNRKEDGLFSLRRLTVSGNMSAGDVLRMIEENAVEKNADGQNFDEQKLRD
jgi:peptidoglycan/xylan/chitin deacetylase (PgdA/CDA1 family)